MHLPHRKEEDTGKAAEGKVPFPSVRSQPVMGRWDRRGKRTGGRPERTPGGRDTWSQVIYLWKGFSDALK